MNTTSSKPSKQRKYLYNLLMHRRSKILTAPLSEDQQKQHGIKRIYIRKGDTVIVMRGEFQGSEGKVVSVNRKTGRITIENVTRKKADGNPVYVPIHASKVVITKLDTSDPRRVKIIERRAKKQG